MTKDWMEGLEKEMQKPYYLELMRRVTRAYDYSSIYPERDKLFEAFSLTPLQKVKVVILGQDPYHGEGQAHGLCFSVQKDMAIPKSLQNIYKELVADIGCTPPSHGCLEGWARQGVFLLNTVLSVEAGKANSHQGIGWERFTDAVIRILESQDRPMVFILWGKPAQTKKKLLQNEKHLILEAPHPSPLSVYRGFYGSAPFSQCNAYLEARGCSPIDWSIT